MKMNQPESLREALTRLNGGRDSGEPWVKHAWLEKNDNRVVVTTGLSINSGWPTMPLIIVGIRRPGAIVPRIWHAFGAN